MRAFESLKTCGVLAVLGFAPGALAACANDYTCADYQTCVVDGAVLDGAVDVAHGDAKSDGSITKSDGGHDGATDGSGDAHVPDGGADVVQGDSGKDAGCSSSLSPSTSPCVVTEEYGVFVAPAKDGGSDAGAGTRTAPYATIAEGIANAGTKRVYVCAATYAESLVIGTAVDGVQVYGGFACPGSDAGAPAWTYVSGTVAAVAPSAAGYALDLESLAKGTHFEDMSFTAVAAMGSTGASSIAVLVNVSTGVSFTRVTSKAGSGAAGVSPGAPVSNWCAAAGQVGQVGELVAAGGAGGGFGNCMCAVATGDSSRGGAGGSVDSAGNAGIAMPAAAGPGGGTGALGAASPGGSCSVVAGGAGENGSSTTGGGAGGAGSVGSSGWVPAFAGAGLPGNPGQGGGGGGGDDLIGGAGGGAGGCGGNGGAGGGGGGASLAFAVVGSAVTFNAVKLAPGTGGPGGAGADGQAGQTGGNPGGSVVGCNGGPGGAGAGGGGGGGGAGGPSVGIAWHGGTTVLTVDGMVTMSATNLSGASSFIQGMGGGAGAPGGPGTAASGGNGGAGGTMGPAGTSSAIAQY